MIVLFCASICQSGGLGLVGGILGGTVAALAKNALPEVVTASLALGFFVSAALGVGVTSAELVFVYVESGFSWGFLFPLVVSGVLTGVFGAPIALFAIPLRDRIDNRAPDDPA